MPAGMAGSLVKGIGASFWLPMQPMA